jgi:YegS/Rv2252/BmrU family lipid kinase
MAHEPSHSEGLDDTNQSMTTALLIYNPTARHRLDDRRLAAVLAIARGAGWQVDAVPTQRAGHATEIARDAAARGVDVVVVHGGDGTLNDAVNGVAGTETAVAVLRGGTANIWAKESGTPKDAVKAMRSIVGGERRRVDLGRAGDRYFLLMAGVGLDARIVRRVGGRAKRWLGALAYLVFGVSVVFRTKTLAVDLAIDSDESERSLYWMIVGNTRLYGGLLPLTYRAHVDDGALDVALMRRGGMLRVLADGARALVRRHDRSSNVRYVTARSVDVRTPGIPVQLDGEPHGVTPIRFDVVPLALNVVVPRSLKSPLWSEVPSRHATGRNEN